jgi:hypothetical protein
MYLYDLQRKESKSGPGVAKNIYLLEMTKAGNKESPNYDVSYRFVVIATTEEEARKLAQSQGEDECDYGDYKRNKPFWTEPKYTSIEVIGTTATFDDSVRVVANCFNAG